MKKRKIIWSRLALVVLVPVVVITAVVSLISKQQAYNREHTFIDLTVDGITYIVNADEFIDYKKGDLSLEDLEIKDEGRGDPIPNNEGIIAQEDIPSAPQGIQSFEIETSEEPLEESVPNFKTLKSLGEFKLTGYCNCEECCGKWAGGPCADGNMPVAGVTVAVDDTIIPLGTHLLINGHEYIAQDTGSAIKGNRIDVYCDTHEECFDEQYNGMAEVFIIEE